MKSVLVTGGSGGIGSAICRELALRGYFVGVNYNKNKQTAEELAKEIGGVAIKFDVSNRQEVISGVNQFISIAGGITALVNNSGVAQSIKPLIDTSLEEFEEVFSVNIKGTFLVTKEVIPHMLENGGSIVNVSSMWGEIGASCESVYSASKAAVNSFTKSLAKEYATAKIRVNAVAPGFIDTKMNDNLSPQDKELVIQDTPLNRSGTPQEVAKCVSFLLEDATFTTGEVLSVSGGIL